MILRPAPYGARLGLFGQPWHGLAEQPGASAAITLPNAETHPVANISSGNTRLVDIATAPSRTTEQLAADEAAGMEWRADAILNYAYLGTGRWLYQASTGAIWEIYDDAGAWMVRPFGVVGGAAVTPQPVAASDLTTGAVWHDTRPDLQRALVVANVEAGYSLSVGPPRVESDLAQYQVHEVTITDAGTLDSVELSATLLSSHTHGAQYEETMGSISCIVPVGETGAEVETQTGVVATAGESRSVSVYARYNLAGEPVVMESVETATRTTTSTGGASVTPPNIITSFWWEWESTITKTLQIIVDGIVIAEATPIVIAELESSTWGDPYWSDLHTITITGPWIDGEWVSSVANDYAYHGIVRCAVGGAAWTLETYLTHYSTQTYSGTEIVYTSPTTYTVTDVTPDYGGLQIATSHRLIVDPDTGPVVTASEDVVVALSDTVLAIRSDLLGADRVFSGFATPDGDAAIEPITAATLYASRHPRTGEAAIEPHHVCWF